MHQVTTRISLAALMTLVFISVWHQDGVAQTKDETVKFLSENASFKTSFSFRRKFNDNRMVRIDVTQKVTFEDGVMVVFLEQINQFGQLVFRDTYKVDPKNLNPKRNKLHDSAGGKSLQLFCTGDKAKVTWTYTHRLGETDFGNPGPFGTKNEERSDLYFRIPDNERSIRQLTKAVEHLIVLSGGKADLFED